MQQHRIIWVDWMKVLGMYFIIAGHFFPTGYTFIYIFSVPFFFLLSGFLCKKEDDNSTFARKIVYNYVIPLFLIRTIMYFWEYITFSGEFLSIFQYWLYLFKGYQNCNGTCWFIYTLILLRIIFQYLPQKLHILLFVVFSIAAIWLNYHNIHKNNAIINLTVAYQPFYLGFILQRYKQHIISYKPSTKILLCMFTYGILSVGICGKINGNVWLYINGYGNYFLFYLWGIINGTIFIYSMSMIINKLCQQINNIIYTLSIGNIITLGFHTIFVFLFNKYLPQNHFIEYFWSLIIILLFIPIIRCCQFYFPLLLGIYKRPQK
ncbi:acyltransferase family protein [uncultured Prevotella sp.]|uniref:acyltransferase family protein n=1 Tax=uncultured Prevotella sp. TaxID=159272 RepID=UPI00344B4CB4